MKNESVNRKSFFALREKHLDLSFQIEKEIIRIMKENGFPEIHLAFSIKHCFRDKVHELCGVKIVIDCGFETLYFRWSGDNNYYETDWNAGDNINWIELFYNVLESIERGVLD